MKAWLRVYEGTLLLYTGWRTWDFIQSTMPKTEISSWISIAFLFAAEVGLIVWHMISLGHVTTSAQENTARVMTWVDFTASLTAGTADMIIRQTFIEGYQMPRQLADLLIWGLPAVVAANVAAGIVYEQHDAETQLARKKKQLQFKIYKEAIKELDQAAEEIARDKKVPVYETIRAEVTGQIDARYGKRPARSLPVPAEPMPVHEEKPTEVLATTSSNGNKPDGGFLNFTRQRKG